MGLLILVGATVLLVALAPVLAAVLGPRAGWPIAAGLAACTAGAVSVWSSGSLEQSVPWIPSLGVSFSLRMDGLGLLFSVVVLGIGALVMLYSASYITEKRPLAFYTLMVFFAAAMLVLVLADDLVLLFVAWELTTLCSYLLILRSGPNAVRPATRTLLVTAMGGLCLLGAVALIITRTGTTNLTEALASDAWTTDPAFATSAAVLVAIAALTKSAQFPFHAWLPDAMVAPAPVSAYLHAAAMVKAGIYLLLRFADAASASPAWPVILIGIGVLTSVMAAVFALQRTDIKELLAYSTVSQLGMLVAIIGVGGSHAMLAACVHVVAHALFKSAGFMYVGLIERRSGTRDIRELGGLARAMPWTSLMLALAALSMAGVPPLLGFVSKEAIFEAGLDEGAWFAVVGIALAAVFTASYSARLVVHTFGGSPMKVHAPRGTVSMATAVSVSALGGTLLGFGAPLLEGLVRPAAAAASGEPLGEIPDVYLWHGFNTALLISVVVLSLALALVLGRHKVGVLLDRPLFPGTGVGAVNRVHDVIVAGGRRVGDLTRTDQPAAHLAVPITLVAVAGTAAAVTTGGWRSGAPASEPVDVGLLLLVAVGVISVVASRSRMGAVISAGIVGFSVALWFFVLGAADVALTQLLVEFLTVVIIVMVLRRLPRTFQPRAPRRRAVTAVVAAVGGVAATIATLALTGRSSLSPAGEYYLREAENETGAANVVNSILVDFRALDTLGELVVLAVTGLALSVLLRSRRALEGPEVTIDHTALDDATDNLVFLRTLARVLVPVMAGFSLYALLRGHDAPGGGFISALIGAAAVGAAYLSAYSDRWTQRRTPYLAIAGSGVLLAAVIGFVGMAKGSFLYPIKFTVLGYETTTALLFDVGVYLAVFGVVLAAINLLGAPTDHDEDDEPEPVNTSPATSEEDQ